jgi:hypothetical protein
LKANPQLDSGARGAQKPGLAKSAVTEAAEGAAIGSAEAAASNVKDMGAFFRAVWNAATDRDKEIPWNKLKQMLDDAEQSRARRRSK